MKFGFVLTSCAAVLLASIGIANSEVIYNTIPEQTSYALDQSFAYQAYGANEFGDLISFGGTSRDLSQVTVCMCDWAKRSDYMQQDNDNNWVSKTAYNYLNMTEDGYYHDFTFNIYNAGENGTVGSLIATKTINAFIEWRPENYPADNNYWESDGKLYPGVLTNISFDFSSLGVELPDEVIYSIGFNTQNYGLDPTGVAGPYNSLNLAVTTDSPTVGTDVDKTVGYANCTNGSWYTDKGAGGTNTLRADTGWDYTPAVTFETAAVPEPMSILLAIMGLGSITGIKKLQKK